MTRRRVASVIAATMAVFSIALGPSAMAAPRPDPLQRTVLIGDSFANGHKATAGHGYHELLERNFGDRGRDLETFAINGATALLWLQCTTRPQGCPADYKSQLERLVAYQDPTAVIIALGPNERLINRPAKEYGDHIRQIVTSARHAFPGIHVVLVYYYDITGFGIVPPQPGTDCDLRGYCDSYRENVEWAEYGAQLRAIARDTGSQFVDVSQGFSSEDVSADMGHPNDAGNRRIFELLKLQLG